jgi:hypothetical protein
MAASDDHDGETWHTTDFVEHVPAADNNELRLHLIECPHGQVRTLVGGKLARHQIVGVEFMFINNLKWAPRTMTFLRVL